MESFNECLRGECLNVHDFVSQDEGAAGRLEAWRIDCNKHRPHGSPG
ncbi:MAG: transposase [Gammaproteobacteria bacterium]|nr:transposase [Gammaproteobacteria bacterium]